MYDLTHPPQKIEELKGHSQHKMWEFKNVTETAKKISSI